MNCRKTKLGLTSKKTGIMEKSNYQKLSTPPADALKTINAGRLKGKSDINPQWRYEVMTEIYGECGKGWKYNIKEKQIIDCEDGQKMLFVEIELFTQTGEKEFNPNAWSDPIPGVGGDFIIKKEKTGLHFNDEALKMAVTDALSYAMSKIGVAADVYRGKLNDEMPGSKYTKSKKFDRPEIKNWLSEENFEALKKLIKEDHPKAEALFNKYNTPPYGMKNEYRNVIQKLLKNE